jgi:hypothetical protein
MERKTNRRHGETAGVKIPFEYDDQAWIFNRSVLFLKKALKTGYLGY